MTCPKCGSENVNIQRETTGSTTITKHYVKHGLLYYLLVWWWVQIFKFFWWIIKLIFTAGISLFFKKKKEVGTSISNTTNTNKTIAVCQNCGNSWNI